MENASKEPISVSQDRVDNLEHKVDEIERSQVNIEKSLIQLTVISNNSQKLLEKLVDDLEPRVYKLEETSAVRKLAINEQAVIKKDLDKVKDNQTKIYVVGSVIVFALTFFGPSIRTLLFG